MPGVSFNGSSQFLELGSKIATGYPFTIMAWVASTNAASGDAAAAAQGSTTVDAFQAIATQNSVNLKQAVDRSAAIGSMPAQKSTTPNVSTSYQLLVGVFTSAASRTVYFGNNTGVTDTFSGSQNFGDLDRFLIGAARRGSGVLWYYDGSITEVHVFNAALTASDVNTLLTTKPDGNIASWVDGWALQSNTDLTSLGGTRTLSATGSPTTSGLTAPYSRAPAAPTLSSPTVVSTGNGIATVRVTTDVAPSGSSTLAVRTRPAGDPAWTATEVLASPTATLTSGASGARDFNLTGLTNGTALAADFAQTGPSNLVSTASFTPSTVPGAPTIGTAVAGNAQATVNGTAPASNGGAAITGYRSTATPGGSTVTGASLPITHTGLTNGTAYTFTLAAQNANGYGAESAASNSVTPSAPGSAPNITVQPSNQTVTAGATATFSVTATGSGLTYQWRRNGTNISGATSSSYTTPATTVSGGSANNGDLYSVVVTGDTAPPANSSNATLTVNAAPTATLPAVATDATGSAKRLGQTTRMVVEPFTSIEALGTGTRTIVTGTTDPTTGEITLTGLSAGTYAVFGFFPSTGATISGVRFRLVTVA